MSTTYPGVYREVHSLYADAQALHGVSIPKDEAALYTEYSDAALVESVYDELTNAYTLLRVADGSAYRPLSDYPYSMHARRIMEVRALSDHAPFGTDPVGTVDCFQAEMQFIRSLKRLMSPGTDHSRHFPAALLCDINRQPFAYHKHTGTPLAMAWRDAAYKTKSGVFAVTKGTIISTPYGKLRPRGTYYCEDPRLELIGTAINDGLIRLDPDKHQPDTVLFRRFTSDLLPYNVRLFMHTQAAALREDILPPYVPLAMTMGFVGITAAVAQAVAARNVIAY